MSSAVQRLFQVQVAHHPLDAVASSEASTFRREHSANSLGSLEDGTNKVPAAASPAANTTTTTTSFWQTIRKFSSGNMSLSSSGDTAEDAHDWGRYEEDLSADDEGHGLEMACHCQQQDQGCSSSSLLYKLLHHKIENQVTQLLSREQGQKGRDAIVGLGSVLAEVIPRILLLSESEPYGIRGAKLIIKVKRAHRPPKTRPSSSDEDDGAPPTPEPDPTVVMTLSTSTVSTFELILTLNEEKQLGISIKNWLRRWTGNGMFYVISREFKLEKRQLYRMNRTASWTD